jgi:hypothetical protein
MNNESVPWNYVVHDVQNFALRVWKTKRPSIQASLAAVLFADLTADSHFREDSVFLTMSGSSKSRA